MESRRYRSGRAGAGAGACEDRDEERAVWGGHVGVAAPWAFLWLGYGGRSYHRCSWIEHVPVLYRTHPCLGLILGVALMEELGLAFAGR